VNGKMAHQRLGDAKEAKAALDKAIALLKPRTPGGGAGLRPQQILEEMEQSSLLREARSLIDGVSGAASEH
jgi:hypothetical protein